MIKNLEHHLTEINEPRVGGMGIVLQVFGRSSHCTVGEETMPVKLYDKTANPNFQHLLLYF